MRLLPQFLFTVGSAICLPFLPILAWRGRKVKEDMPNLPEAPPPHQGLIGQDSKPLRLLTMGESSIAGVGVDNHQDSITFHLAKHLHRLTGKTVEWNVIARSGFTAKEVCENLVPTIPDGLFDLVVIGLGANDTFQLNSPGNWQKDIAQLIKQIRAKKIHCPIVFSNIPPVHEFPVLPWDLRLVLGKLARLHGMALRWLIRQEKNLFFVDETIYLKKWMQKVSYPTKRLDFFSDGVHPSALTYRLWAEEIAIFVKQQQILDPIRNWDYLAKMKDFGSR